MPGSIQWVDGKIQRDPDSGKIKRLPCDLELPLLICGPAAASRSKCGFYIGEILNVAGDECVYTGYTNNECADCPDHCQSNSGGICPPDNLQRYYMRIDHVATACGVPSPGAPDGYSGGVSSYKIGNPEDCTCPGYDDGNPNASCSGSITNNFTSEVLCDCTGPSHANHPGFDFAPPSSCVPSVDSATLSSEYTTDMLISMAEDDIPAYPIIDTSYPITPTGWSECGVGVSWHPPDVNTCSPCLATRALSSDETGIAVQNFQYFFRNIISDDPPPSGCKLYWVERFIPALEDGSLDLNEDNWVEVEKSFRFDGESHDSGVFEIVHPDSPTSDYTGDGVVGIAKVRWGKAYSG